MMGRTVSSVCDVHQTDRHPRDMLSIPSGRPHAAMRRLSPNDSEQHQNVGKRISGDTRLRHHH